MTDKGFNEAISKAFRYFWKAKKYNNVGWMVLALLDKITKEKNELRDIIFQLQLWS